MKRPAFQFYPADWRKDTALQSCSLSARGLWIELLCAMHECNPYGILSINDSPMPTSKIARLVGESPAKVKRLLEELETAGVCSRNASGAIYSRRMVHDEHIREVRAAAGKKGGNPVLLKQKDKQNTNQTGKQSPTPSSSSSSSEIGNTSAREEISQGALAEHPPNIQAAIALQARGIRVNPTHPDILAAIDEGVTPEELAATADEFPGKAATYVIATARGRRRDGARPVPTGPPAAPRQSRALAAIHELEGMKPHGHNEARLADQRNPDGTSEAPDARLGTTTGAGPDTRNRDVVG